MATPYEKIYDRFSQKITDFNLAEVDDYSLEKMLQSWLNTAIVKTRKCQHDLSQRDEELQIFNEDLSDLEIELLAMGILGLAQENRDVVRVACLNTLAHICSHKECLMEEDSVELRVGVWCRTFCVKVMYAYITKFSCLSSCT